MSNNTIDLRSDTVTQPTEAMRRAMADAVVGDDVFGDDHTVNELEQRTAELLGKEAAVFVPSGTMANQIALRCHTRPGDGLLLEENSHIYLYEGGGPAALSGLTCHLLPGERGIFTPEVVTDTLRDHTNVHFPRSRLLCLENTHNRGGGTIWSLEQLDAVCETGRSHELRLHLDGARLWNATAATGIPESEYAVRFDSVSVCFSKGLGAPVGSALAGKGEFVEQARHVRKQLGGGMRQAGIIAAGALYAMEHHRERLSEDHANALRLAEGIESIPGLKVEQGSVSTNMVYFMVEGVPAGVVAEKAQEMGLLVLSLTPEKIRAVASLTVDAAAIDRAVEILRQVMTAAV